MPKKIKFKSNIKNLRALVQNEADHAMKDFLEEAEEAAMKELGVQGFQSREAFDGSYYYKKIGKFADPAGDGDAPHKQTGALQKSVSGDLQKSKDGSYGVVSAKEEYAAAVYMSGENRAKHPFFETIKKPERLAALFLERLRKVG